jgi:glucose-6-phosphate-specific signal transduction histidine kinase
MKPIRRKFRSNFGLTAKQVAVRSRRPWYLQWLLAFAFMCLGFGIAFLVLHDGEQKTVRMRLDQTLLENKELQTKLIGAQRELQVELATNNNLAKELATVQDESLKVKEELVFYKNMLGKRTGK